MLFSRLRPRTKPVCDMQAAPSSSALAKLWWPCSRRARVVQSMRLGDILNPSTTGWPVHDGASELTMSMSSTVQSIAYDCAVKDYAQPETTTRRWATGVHRLRPCQIRLHQGMRPGLVRTLSLCRNRRAREPYHARPEIHSAEIARSSHNHGRGAGLRARVVIVALGVRGRVA